MINFKRTVSRANLISRTARIRANRRSVAVHCTDECSFTSTTIWNDCMATLNNEQSFMLGTDNIETKLSELARYWDR